MKTRILLVLFVLLFVYLFSISGVLLYSSSNPDRQITLKFDPAIVNVSLQPINVTNPSFELKGSTILGWDEVLWSGQAAFAQSQKLSRTGSSSAMIISSSEADAAFSTNTSIKYSIISLETYSASVWVISNFSSGVGGMIAIAWFDSNNSYISTSIGEPLAYVSGWTQIFVSGIAPQNAALAQLELHLSGKGSVYYDDVSFSKVVNQFVKGDWSVSRFGLERAILVAKANMLTLNGSFIYAGDEKMTYNMSLNVDVSQYTIMSFTYKTSSTNGSGLCVKLDYADGEQVVAFGPAFSSETTTIYIDPRKTPAYIYYLGQDRKVVENNHLVALEISLENKPDSYSSGSFWLQIENITFYRSNTQDLLLFVESIIVLAAVFGSIIKFKEHGIFFILVTLGASISFIASTAIFILPTSLQVDYLDFEKLLQIAGILISVIGIILEKSYSKRFKSRIFRSNVIVLCAIGLVIIPSLVFVVRLNNALTIPMFDDETSYGISSWQLTHGSLLGLNLATSNSIPQDLMKTGVFQVLPWPNNLAIPYTSTRLYPDFTLVGPYFGEPFLGPLLITPFINLLGFNVFAIRLPFILFGIGTSVLIFLIGLRKGNPLAGLIGSAFFSFNPYMAHYGSEAFLDNILAFFLMASIYFLIKYVEMSNPKKNLYLYLTIAFAAFCALTKVQGVFIPFFIFAILWINRLEIKLFLRGMLLCLGFLSLYPLSGLLVSPQAFLLSLKGLLQLVSTNGTAQLSSVSGFFSFFDLAGLWPVVIAVSSVIYLIAKERDRIFVVRVVREREIFLIAAASWIMYGLLFSLKEWYLISFFAVTAFLVGWTYSDIIVNHQVKSSIIFTAFLAVPSLDKLNVSLVGIAVFFVPIVSTLIIGYLDIKEHKIGVFAKKVIPWLLTLYLITSFVMMIGTSWNYKFWA